MKRIVWWKIRSEKIRMFKLIGAFLMSAAVLMVFSSLYHIILVVDKARMATNSCETSMALFGWSRGCPEQGFIWEDIVGVLLGPTAEFLFWLAIVIVGMMVYQTGQFTIPIEEHEIVPSEIHAHAEKAKEKQTKKK